MNHLEKAEDIYLSLKDTDKNTREIIENIKEDLSKMYKLLEEVKLLDDDEIICGKTKEDLIVAYNGTIEKSKATLARAEDIKKKTSIGLEEVRVLLESLKPKMVN